MLKNFWLTALLVPTLLLGFGCGADPDDDDDDDDIRYPFIVQLSPEAGGTANFFYRSSLVAEFDIAPDSATVRLEDASGASVDGTVTVETNGRVVTFDPTEDLNSAAAYTMIIEWSPSEEGDSPYTNAFQTSAHGGIITDPSLMVGQVYAIDLAGATFVEPPGIGPILQSQMDGFSVLFTPMAESDFDGGELHVMGAVGGSSEDGELIQDPCAPTLAFTNPDGIFGNEDDTPAVWDNPEMILAADKLPLTIQGVTATIQDLLISGTFHPDLSNMRGGVFAGIIDTRPLVGALGNGENESEICDLVESTVGVPCISCTTDDGDDTDEVFCLSLRAEDLGADVIEGLSLQERTCELIIGEFINGGSCPDEAGAYDADDDGIYELCPGFDLPVIG
jgi:hypothetical protein